MKISSREFEKYDRYYHLLDTDGRTDHLVHYGFYTDDVARLMKISSRLSDCRSIRDLVIHFIFPNAAFKFRQRGRYKVSGVKEMINKIYDDHRGILGRHKLLAYLRVVAVDGVCRTDRGLRPGRTLRDCPIYLALDRLGEPGNGVCCRQRFRAKFISQCCDGGRAGPNGVLPRSYHSDRVNIGGVRFDLCIPSAWMDTGAI